jgi:hypothetical protein
VKTLILNDHQVTLLGHAIFNYRNLLKDEAHGGESNVILVQDAIKELAVISTELDKGKSCPEMFKEKHGTD